MSGRSPQRGAEVVEQIHTAGGNAEFIAADLDGSAQTSLSLAADATRALGGRIDVLVNNAGIFRGSTTPTVNEAIFDEVYAVNVKPLFLAAAIAPEMSARGSGSIINLGSWVARLGIPVGALYASTKGARETLTRAWAAEFGSPGVRVNAISPGVLRTPNENDPATAMMNGTAYRATCRRLSRDVASRATRRNPKLFNQKGTRDGCLDQEPHNNRPQRPRSMGVSLRRRTLAGVGANGSRMSGSRRGSASARIAGGPAGEGDSRVESQPEPGGDRGSGAPPVGVRRADGHFRGALGNGARADGR